MTTLTAEAAQLDARDISRAASFRVEFVRDWKQARARWNGVTPSTPFQDLRWLDAWYQAFAGTDDVEPLIAVVSEQATGEQVALLPLIRRVQNGIRIVEFADLELTDYNAPVLGSAAPRTAKGSTCPVARPDGCVTKPSRRGSISCACARCRSISTAVRIPWRSSMACVPARSTAMW